MSNEIEQNLINPAQIPPVIQPFKRQMPYADYVLLNETQELLMSEFYRNRIIYYVGFVLSAVLIGAALALLYANFHSSVAHLVTGAAMMTVFITFAKLRRQYKREERFINQVIFLRYENKVMRDQDKPLLCEFAKKMKLKAEVQEIIKSGEYLPYSETEVIAYENANPPEKHDFSKKQYRQLWYVLMTTRSDLECFMVVGLGMTLITVLWNEDLNIVLSIVLWALTTLFASVCVWNVWYSRKLALEACADGKSDLVAENMKEVKPYTFLKVGDHLAHLVVSGTCLIGLFTVDTEMGLTRKIILLVAALLTFLLTLFAMRRSVQSANRYKAKAKADDKK